MAMPSDMFRCIGTIKRFNIAANMSMDTSRRRCPCVRSRSNKTNSSFAISRRSYLPVRTRLSLPLMLPRDHDLERRLLSKLAVQPLRPE
jgi:hypothetical protein